MFVVGKKLLLNTSNIINNVIMYTLFFQYIFFIILERMKIHNSVIECVSITYGFGFNLCSLCENIHEKKFVTRLYEHHTLVQTI